MSNGYFNFTTPFIRNTLGRAEAVNAVFISVAAGFELLPPPEILNDLALDGFISVARGGTGANTAAQARVNLGLGTASQNNTGDFKAGGAVESIATGGTGANTAVQARFNLGVPSTADANATYSARAANLSDLTSTSVARTNLGLGTAATVSAGSFKAAGAVESIATGGTGGTTAATARAGLGLGTAALNNTGDFKAGGTVESIATGGTGANTASQARLNLGVPSTSDANATYSSRAANLSDLASAAASRGNLGLGTASQNNVGDFKAAGVEPVFSGGTGANTAAGARTNLGLGSNALGNRFVQPLGSDPTSAPGDIVFEY